MGRKLQGSHSSPFLNKGVNWAIFQLNGNFPMEKDRLINLAILGATAAAEEQPFPWRHPRRARQLSS